MEIHVEDPANGTVWNSRAHVHRIMLFAGIQSYICVCI